MPYSTKICHLRQKLNATVPSTQESVNTKMVIEHSLSDDLANSAVILEKVQSDRYAQNLYAAMCNMRWQKTDIFPILKDELWTCTWRSAGGIVAELQGKGDYLNWYCSGMTGGVDYNDEQIANGYVSESVVTEEILADLKSLGWHPVPWEDDE